MCGAQSREHSASGLPNSGATIVADVDSSGPSNQRDERIAADIHAAACVVAKGAACSDGHIRHSAYPEAYSGIAAAGANVQRDTSAVSN